MAATPVAVATTAAATATSRAPRAVAVPWSGAAPKVRPSPLVRPGPIWGPYPERHAEGPEAWQRWGPAPRSLAACLDAAPRPPALRAPAARGPGRSRCAPRAHRCVACAGFHGRGLRPGAGAHHPPRRGALRLRAALHPAPGGLDHAAGLPGRDGHRRGQDAGHLPRCRLRRPGRRAGARAHRQRLPGRARRPGDGPAVRGPGPARRPRRRRPQPRSTPPRLCRRRDLRQRQGTRLRSPARPPRRRAPGQPAGLAGPAPRRHRIGGRRAPAARPVPGPARRGRQHLVRRGPRAADPGPGR